MSLMLELISIGTSDTSLAMEAAMVKSALEKIIEDQLHSQSLKLKLSKDS
jgi:hypothetical protein